MRTLSDQELIDVSHHWRRLALTGTPGAVAEARRYETELRRRFGTLDLAASAGDRPDRQPATPSGSAPWPATPSSTDRTDGDTGDVAARVATRSAEAGTGRAVGFQRSMASAEVKTGSTVRPSGPATVTIDSSWDLSTR